MLIVLLTSFYPRKIKNIITSSLFSLVNNFISKSIIINKKGEQFKIIEYSLLLLFVIIGALFLISSADLVTMFISLELQSYGLYIVSSAYRNSESATGGGLMYFLLGGLSSCFILLSTALLYSNSGTTNFDNLYIINTISNYSLVLDTTNLYWYNCFYITIAFIVMSVGFLFKVSAAPFHFWSPDVYDAIPTLVTTFVAIIAKISIFSLFLELVYFSNKTYTTFYWTKMLLISCLLSLSVGTILGLSQSRIKRLYAYSTISHVGFILLALSITTLESIQSFVFYLIQYSVSNLNAFIILLSIGYLFYNLTYKGKENYKDVQEKNYSPIQYIDQITGYYYLNPILSTSLAISLFSFIGVPPLVGFFGKQMILSSAIDNNYLFMSFIAILTSVIGAGYYLAIIKQMFFYKSEHQLLKSISPLKGYRLHLTKMVDNSRSEITNNSNGENTKLVKVNYNSEEITLSSYLSIIISLITMLILLFMFIPNQLINLINICTIIFLNA